MPIRLGINPIGWSNDDMPALGGQIPLETCLAEASGAGYQGIELGGKFPRDHAALRDTLAPFGLACVSGWYGAALLRRDVRVELEAARPHIDLLRAMSSPVVVWAETSNTIHSDIDRPLSARPVLAPDDWPAFAARLTEIARILAGEGIRLAFHHHMGTVVQSGDDIARLMDTTGPEVGLLLDTGHASWAGADPAALARTYEARIIHVHAKDVRSAVAREADAQDWSFLRAVLEGVYTVPGNGSVDFGAVLAALPNYEGWIVVEAEQDPAKANPLEYATSGYAHLRTLLGPRA